ncbi:MAG: deoxynucleoside kinase [Micavibrio aeruginosavorus]|nr:deoxynucleoside kinase [Micavibrio aeruginosavorus]
MRIELVGGLGIGKSTLCHALDKIGFNSIYENLSTNPFLADCFKDPANFRFPSQMWFALSKFHEIKKFERNDRINVLDQSVLNVRAYTNMLFRNEDADALHIINQCFDYLEGKLGKPDLLINLKCSPQEQLRRIRGRNRDHEKSVALDYIADLQQEMNILINQAKADGYAVLDIDTEKVYFPDNVLYAEQLAQQIADMFKLDLTCVLEQGRPYQYGLAVAAE